MESNAQRGKSGVRECDLPLPGRRESGDSEYFLSSEPGEVTAIIGGTGSGKSTLISLIPRFYDIEEGADRIDGHDVTRAVHGCSFAR